MEWLANICVAVVGFAGGVGVAGGVFAFISILGILPRLAGRMGLAKYLYSLENMIAYGGIAGTIVSVFQLPLPIGYIGGMVIGFFSGIFTGALIMALAGDLKSNSDPVPSFETGTRSSDTDLFPCLRKSTGKLLPAHLHRKINSTDLYKTHHRIASSSSQNKSISMRHIHSF